MKHLTIVVPEGENNLSSIVGAYKIFSRANEYWKRRKGRSLFQIQLAGVSAKVGFYEDLFVVKPHTSIAGIKRTHLVIVPSLNHNYDESLKRNERLVEWIAAQHRRGAEVASICTGAFLLAAAGLLDGKSCSTHWAAASDFRLRYPGINLEPDKIITDENGVYTNGGAYSFLNLMVYLVEKYFDRETAIFCSKVFQIDFDRQSQSPFAIFSGQKSHGDEMVMRAQSYFESNLDKKVSVDELSSRFSVGRRSFDRRFIKATGNTPLEYFQRVKIEAAKKLFENTRKSVTDVMFGVGYSDAKAFRDVFRRITGMSPLSYRNKYNKEAVL